ncbi:DsbA family protein [Kocuria rhizophila]|uniref:thioredoxin domain-containing protein n=1 Tax=Kocuria TaxID=57493 RepID=UPI0002DFD104|nr:MULTISPECIES: thioredoxin domain-containing protein [Kocuria]MCR4526710.1 DsbA family protein [Kocuria rhizophila]MCT1545336.1 DsbA family protein [Kocuria rhizophila]MCT1917796.1 DsbA family protein [Kocuria rhizophila]MCT2172687.1 DsbA family protein [Kocuria rhizophila]MDA4829060.1 thioredoxin domain-containing protein [Kocuria rhizophila]
MVSKNNNAGSSPADARERARQIADRQARRHSGRPLGLILGIVALVLAIVLIIGLVMWQNSKSKIPEAGPVPASANQYGGITVTKDGIPQNTSDVEERDLSSLPPAPEEPDTTKTPPGIVDADKAATNGEPVQLVVFQDYECVHCADFEKENAELLKKYVDAGKLDVEYRNLNFLDKATPDQYSSRAANAAYLVAEQVSADQFLEYSQEVFTHQGTGGLSNQELAEIAGKHGASVTAEDIDENTYRPMVDVATRESVTNGVAGTPTMFVDGKRYEEGAFEDMLKKAVDAKK